MHPLSRLSKLWCSLLKVAKKHKAAKFGDDADRAMRYFRANVNEVWDHTNVYGGGKELSRGQGFVVQDAVDDDNKILPPSFRICLVKAMELVQLFGPTLYPADPLRIINPIQDDFIPIELYGSPQDPAVQQFHQQSMQQIRQKNIQRQEVSRVLSRYLNYTPRELRLKWEARRVIDEAVVKGMGTFWHEMHYPYHGCKPIVGSFYDTVDALLMDPDERESIKDCKWIARECQHPYWEVEEEYGLPKDSLKKYARRETAARAAYVDDEDYSADMRYSGTSEDLITYYKIWSKMGVGNYLADATDSLREQLPEFSRYSYLVVCEDVPWPLNCHKDEYNQSVLGGRKEEIIRTFDWPVPFWADNKWPFTPVMFHPQPNCVWPVSHLKPGLGLLNFLNWCMGFLAVRVRTSCQTHVGVLKGAADDLKEQLFSGRDFNIIELEAAFGSDIKNVVSMLESPQVNGDMWRMIEWVLTELEKSLGLTEVLYGTTTTQPRSAAESQIKQSSASTRIDDMRTVVEEAETQMARSEAFMARWMLQSEDVEPMVGQADAGIWRTFITTTDIEQVVREFDYRIEADSARPPNRQQKIQALGEWMQAFGGVAVQAAGAGQVGPINWAMKTFAKLNNMDGIEEAMLQPPPPPDPQNNPSPQMLEREKIQAEMAMKQQDQMKAQMDSQAKIEMEREKLAMDQQRLILEQKAAEADAGIKIELEQKKLELEERKIALDMEAQKAKMENDRQKTLLDLEAKRAEQGLRRQEAMVKLATEREKAAAQANLAKEKHVQEMQFAQQKHKQDAVMRERESQQKMQLAEKASKEQVAKKRNVKKKVTKRDDQGRLAEWSETEE